FGETFAVVEFEHRHLALAVDGPIVRPRFGFLFLIVDLLQVEVGAHLAHHDMGRERAGTGRKVKLHHDLLDTTPTARPCIDRPRGASRYRPHSPRWARRTRSSANSASPGPESVMRPFSST